MSWEWVAAIVAILLFLGYLDARRKAKERAHLFNIEGTGEFDVEAVGESHYQPALRSLVQGKGYVREEFTARLVCDDANRHDKNAVRVEIAGKHVGHLPRAHAAVYRDFLRKNDLGVATGLVQAVIIGGGKDKPSYGVWLDMA